MEVAPASGAVAPGAAAARRATDVQQLRLHLPFQRGAGPAEETENGRSAGTAGRGGESRGHRPEPRPRPGDRWGSGKRRLPRDCKLTLRRPARGARDRSGTLAAPPCPPQLSAAPLLLRHPRPRAGSSPVNLATPSAGLQVPLSVRGRVAQHGTPPPVQGRVLVRVHVRTLQGRQNIAIQF